MTTETQIHLFFQYAIQVAQTSNYNRLTAIHLIKYIYLADYYSKKINDTRFTDWNWIMWDFGPWCPESNEAIKNAYESGMLLSDKAISTIDEENEYTYFHCKGAEWNTRELEQVGSKLFPNIQTRMAVEGAIKTYGLQTNPLLHFVYYETEPVQGITKGQSLAFETITPINSQKTKDSPNISRKKQKKAKEILKQLKNKKKRHYNPPEMKVDDIYIQGMNFLNEQDEPSLSDGYSGYANVKEALFDEE